MKASFDGMRKRATLNMNRLANEIERLTRMAQDGKYFEVDDFEELIRVFNDSASSVDIMNCLYDDNVEDDMTDLSNLLSIETLDIDDFREEK